MAAKKKRTPRGPDKQPRRPRNTSPLAMKRRRQDLIAAVRELWTEAQTCGMKLTGRILSTAAESAELERDFLEKREASQS